MDELVVFAAGEGGEVEGVALVVPLLVIAGVVDEDGVDGGGLGLDGEVGIEQAGEFGGASRPENSSA